jgi:hypothetical protein
MEYEAAEYQKVQIRSYAPRSIRETSEGKYWKRFKTPVVAKEVLAACGAPRPTQPPCMALDPPAPFPRPRSLAPCPTSTSASSIHTTSQ